MSPFLQVSGHRKAHLAGLVLLLALCGFLSGQTRAETRTRPAVILAQAAPSTNVPARESTAGASPQAPAAGTSAQTPAAGTGLRAPAARPTPAGAADAGPDAATQALNRARELRAAKQPEQALELAEKGLAVAPRDLQLRFIKGLLLSELRRPDQAIAVFEALTQDFPELGEPYNNLAVLLAGRGELERARYLLERALQAQPGYALAWENLGDVQLRLAEKAYAEAVSKNPALRSARSKLDQAREWIKAADAKP